MLGDVSPQTIRITPQAVVYPGRNHVVRVLVEKTTDGRRYTKADVTDVTRAVLVFLGTDPTIAYDSATDAVFTFAANGIVEIDLSDYAMPTSIYQTHLVLFDAEHTNGQVIVDNVDTELSFDFRNVSTTGDTPPPTVAYVTEAPLDGGLYGRQDGDWVSIADVVAGVVSVNGQTGVVVLDAADVGAATAAQGTLADSAVQPGDLATVATSGAYADLSGTPALGTAAAADTGDFDTAGAATAAVSAHEGEVNPHTQYTTQTDNDARYERGLTAGTNISIDRTNPDAPVINASGGGAGEANTASNLGSGVGLFAQKDGVDLEFKGLVAGTNITLTPSSTGVTIDAAGGGGGGAVDSVNGATGVVVLDTDDINEGATNLYYTDARAEAAAPVQTVDGQTGAVDLSAVYAPLSHVGAGGGAHANAVAAGAAGFMTGADKDKLDGIAASANNYSHPNHSGDVTSVGDGVQTIANDAVTNAKLANMATATIKGRTTAGTGDPEDLTATQVRTLLNVADGATANSSDASLRDRSTHTNTQAASTISDFNSASRAQTEAMLVAGTNVTLTPGSSGATRTLTVNASGSGGASLVEVIAYAGTSKTLALADINTLIDCTSSSAVTITIPPQSAETWTADAEIHIRMSGAGVVSVAVGSGVTIPPLTAPVSLAGEGSVVTLKRRNSDVWAVIGAVAGNNGATLEWATYGGTANAITLTPITTRYSYQRGDVLRFRATTTNTGATTVDVNGLGTKTCLTVTGAALPAGYIRTDADTTMTYDGTNVIVSRETERGSNANGSFIRYAHGELRCQTTSAAQDATTTAGSLFVTTATNSWTLPAVYSAAPLVGYSPDEALRWGTVSGVSTTTVSYRQVRPATSAATVTGQLTAQGFWY